jgi:mutual gliding-motility protein MglA
MRAADGIIFVADSQIARRGANLGAIGALHDLLVELGRDPNLIPLVFALNKRDLPGIYSEENLRALLPWPRCDHVATTATTGDGIPAVVQSLVRLVLSAKE